jgi:hypothetical protein
VLARLTVNSDDPDDAIYDLALQAIAATGKEPLHCPGILLHVAGDPAATPKARSLYLPDGRRRAAVEAFIARRPSLSGVVVEGPGPGGFLRLRHPLPDPQPLVSIVIPTRDRKELLEACIDSLERATSYRNKEIIIVDNDSADAETKAYFAALSQRPDMRIMPAPGPFNYPRLINLGASQARGELLMTLNNDIEAFEPAALSRSQRAACRRDRGLERRRRPHVSRCRARRSGLFRPHLRDAGSERGHRRLPADATLAVRTARRAR